MILFAIRTGSLKVSIVEFFTRLFDGDERIMTVVDLRLPRIAISVIGGFAIGVSGVLFQAVMKNPLADPGLLGISSGASFIMIVVTGMFPSLFFIAPIIAFVGGILSCFLVYLLAWKNGIDPFRVILVGIAVNAVFLGLIETVQTFMGGNLNIIKSFTRSDLSLKNWSHFYSLFGYSILFLAIAFLMSSRCDLIAMEDKTISSLGINVHSLKSQISIVAVFLAAISTVILGSISFLGLLAPYIARMCVGGRHKFLIPFSMLTGGLLLLIADTIGRTIAAPNEIGVGIIMMVMGGPFFIILLKKTGGKYG